MSTDTTTTDDPGRGRTTRRRLLMGLGAAVLLAGGGTGIAIASGALPTRRGEKEKPTGFTGATGEITRGDLQGETSAQGTLRFADSHTVRSGFQGVVTQLPTAGAVIHSGECLYQVGDEPAYLFRGSVPAWRTFESGMSNGEDITQLQTVLGEMGHMQAEPDGNFGWRTIQAVRAWQKAVGLERTGSLPLGRIVFDAGDLRVGELKSRLGDTAAAQGDLYNATSTAQVVDVNLKLADQQLAVVGNKVALHLPGAVESTGTITAVGTPVEKTGSDNSSKERFIPLTVVPDDLSATSSFQEVSVTVGLPSEKRENVLSVPVSALIALTAEQFGVELVEDGGSTRKVPVTTGMFAGGRVEVSGEGLAEGQRVVVPQR